MWKFTSFFLYYLVAIFTLGQTSLAIDAFNCSNVEVDGIKFDLSNLKLQNITKEEQTPPTITITSSLINLCEPLPIDKKNETCPDGTYVCQIITNKLSKEDKSPRVITIRPIAGDLNDEGIFKPVIALEPASNKDDTSGPLLITLNGGSYAEQKQQANFTFICNTEKDNITTLEYNNEENTLIIRWETPAACGQKILEDKGMSGFTKFIIFLIIIALCYFGFGAAYNYHVYKAHGWDLLPHLDFWRDFPYLISDVFKYLINSIRTGQAGYNRV